MSAICASALVAALVTMAPAAAQSDVRVVVGRGLTSLIAHEATARTIVAEWARVGGVTVTGSEHIPDGPPLTLEMTDVPEGQALNELLGGLNYVLTLRSDPFRDGTSIYNGLLIHSKAEMAEIERKRQPLVAIPPESVADPGPRAARDWVPPADSEDKRPTAESLVAVPSRPDVGTVETSSDKPTLFAIPLPVTGAAPIGRPALESPAQPANGPTPPKRSSAGA